MGDHKKGSDGKEGENKRRKDWGFGGGDEEKWGVRKR